MVTFQICTCIMMLLLLAVAPSVSSFSLKRSIVTPLHITTTTTKVPVESLGYSSFHLLQQRPSSQGEHQQILHSNSIVLQASPGKGDDDKGESFDEFLDKPFFDPDAILENQKDDEEAKSLQVWFANLVKNDYELAETLFAGIFFVILLLITQELLRMQMYGDNYVPFLRGGGSSTGKLF